MVFCAGLDGSIELEGRDRPFDLPYGQDRLIRELCRVNPNTVVVLHAGGGINMTPWINSCAAAIHAFYPGEEGGNALAHILSGKVNPSAKLPFTIERRWADSPAAGNYDETRREKKIYYREGIFTGYRGYENATSPRSSPSATACRTPLINMTTLTCASPTGHAPLSPSAST